MSTVLTELPGATWRTVARVVLPADTDADALPLYVDYDHAVAAPASTETEAPTTGGTGQSAGAPAQFVSVPQESHAEDIRGRRGLVVRAGARASFATYFNAFPASYWRRWTSASAVRLRVLLEAEGTVTVYRSNARGLRQRVTSRAVAGGRPLELELSLASFGDGGWYWFDVSAGGQDTTLLEAEWQVTEPAGTRPRHDSPATLSIAVTTYNRPDFCLALLRSLAEAPDVREVLDEVLIMDQGDQLVQDQPGFAEVAEALGEQLRIVRQGNLGGSGGFARGMRETLRAGRSDYVLLLDDDIIVETEGILRALQFAASCRRPTIVGGHMFDMFDRSVLHSFGERVDLYRFFWGALPGLVERHDLGGRNLRATPWMHKRADVDYNGWWMCLIPVEVLREVGLSLPVFIKWDDAEYGLRAAEAGFPTVSLPGAAVWHVSWIDKDDSTDWQAYFHERNRIVAALLHSPYEHGGRIFRESVFTDVKHLISMQYSTEALRLMALEDVLAGPEHLLRTLPTRTAEVRALRKEFPDAKTSTDVDAFPAARRRKPPKKGKEPQSPNKFTLLPWAASVVARQLATAPAPEALQRPEGRLAAMDSTWWRLAHYDSAVVSTADGTAAAWYKRDPKRFRELLTKSAAAHRQLWQRWDELSKAYREQLPHFTSVEAWDTIFDASTISVERPGVRASVPAQQGGTTSPAGGGPRAVAGEGR
ncbi:galactofuranosylgalactofuranosylrhamnosyl-N-acetylglucosaminyl-diphospho-decaprenol beta-1,5/1,6-galactofuranosyltransferase [Kineococcus xinjiangensis]|uniref:Galactofuranosylgalactofuranosylrhamnosyl-N-acetylglucosaminyl-diphospho-decaprenol beta-1,5/1,6-galactofuranosyltransferase n=1 Tax=Kineococcus xinjiangensis TaxID=512762 RepID=A0A2S6IU29_9ACTN|nr:glycosyltransferase [Kineococcus xinjiangensis]PPK97753.1 galactofuranosylgalactofuranosylrhamnosyl-N-acetylglucosaminyl-diphospho-decaprenol beta-1,5/1,6-galactofuranosyltransferase [Kineococcus xinjiangensis]